MSIILYFLSIQDFYGLLRKKRDPDIIKICLRIPCCLPTLYLNVVCRVSLLFFILFLAFFFFVGSFKLEKFLPDFCFTFFIYSTGRAPLCMFVAVFIVVAAAAASFVGVSASHAWQEATASSVFPSSGLGSGSSLFSSFFSIISIRNGFSWIWIHSRHQLS